MSKNPKHKKSDQKRHNIRASGCSGAAILTNQDAITHLKQSSAWAIDQVEEQQRQWLKYLQNQDLQTIDAAIAALKVKHDGLVVQSKEGCKLPDVLHAQFDQISAHHLQPVQNDETDQLQIEDHNGILAGIGAHVTLNGLSIEHTLSELDLSCTINK